MVQKLLSESVAVPRRSRAQTDGVIFHVLNRATRRARLFATTGDYAAFERVLGAAVLRHPAKLLAYCLMPTHWHLVVWPASIDQLSLLMHWLTVTHSRRWGLAHKEVGTGPIYQGRFKAFPLRDERYLLNVLRYVEQNPLRAGLVQRAEQWRWSSAWRRIQDLGEVPLSAPPIPLPPNWLETVNRQPGPSELHAIRVAVNRNRPLDQIAGTAISPVPLSM